MAWAKFSAWQSALGGLNSGLVLDVGLPASAGGLRPPPPVGCFPLGVRWPGLWVWVPIFLVSVALLGVVFRVRNLSLFGRVIGHFCAWNLSLFWPEIGHFLGVESATFWVWNLSLFGSFLSGHFGG